MLFHIEGKEKTAMSKVHQSACPLNCWDSCGFLVTVDDGKVTKVDGDPNHPITEGKICGRGRMLETKTNSPDRLRYPMKKQNETVQHNQYKLVIYTSTKRKISLSVLAKIIITNGASMKGGENYAAQY